jgi:hypothetical protein
VRAKVHYEPRTALGAGRSRSVILFPEYRTSYMKTTEKVMKNKKTALLSGFDLFFNYFILSRIPTVNPFGSKFISKFIS